MANSDNRRLDVSEFDFDDVKTNLKTFLKAQAKFKDYNFWTIKDNLSLDGKERRVVTITQKKYSDIINSYYIEYYQDGTIEFRKNIVSGFISTCISNNTIQ